MMDRLAPISQMRTVSENEGRIACNAVAEAHGEAGTANQSSMTAWFAFGSLKAAAEQAEADALSLECEEKEEPTLNGCSPEAREAFARASVLRAAAELARSCAQEAEVEITERTTT